MNVKKPYGVIQITCIHCNTILEIDVGDVYPDELGFIKGGDCACDCGQCGKVIPLQSKKLPFVWLKHIFYQGH